MFENLSDRLGGVFDRLTKQGALTEDDVTAAMREVRVALLEADVSLPVARNFVKAVKTNAKPEQVNGDIEIGLNNPGFDPGAYDNELLDAAIKQSTAREVDRELLENTWDYLEYIVPLMVVTPKVETEDERPSGGNVIEYNKIVGAGRETPDVGAIYTFSQEDQAHLGDTILVQAHEHDARQQDEHRRWQQDRVLDLHEARPP